MRNDFTLFKRVYPNGTKVFFYYAYDKDGGLIPDKKSRLPSANSPRGSGSVARSM